VFKKKWKKYEPKNDEAEKPKPAINPERAREKTMTRAFNILSVKPYSVAEMRRRLLEKDWTTPEIVDAVLEKLKEYNYLNDAQYAENFAAYNIRQKPQGKRKLQLKLAQKRIDKDTAKDALEKVFEETPEADLLDQALEKRLRIKGIPQDRDETKKLFDYLLRQGFNFDLVRDKVRDIGKTEIENE
jgi:regulatory protein